MRQNAYIKQLTYNKLGTHSSFPYKGEAMLFELGYSWSLIMVQTCSHMLETVTGWKVHRKWKLILILLNSFKYTLLLLLWISAQSVWCLCVAVLRTVSTLWMSPLTLFCLWMRMRSSLCSITTPSSEGCIENVRGDGRGLLFQFNLRLNPFSVLPHPHWFPVSNCAHCLKIIVREESSFPPAFMHFCRSVNLSSEIGPDNKMFSLRLMLLILFYCVPCVSVGLRSAMRLLLPIILCYERNGFCQQGLPW